MGSNRACVPEIVWTLGICWDLSTTTQRKGLHWSAPLGPNVLVPDVQTMPRVHNLGTSLHTIPAHLGRGECTLRPHPGLHRGIENWVGAGGVPCIRPAEGVRESRKGGSMGPLPPQFSSRSPVHPDSTSPGGSEWTCGAVHSEICHQDVWSCEGRYSVQITQAFKAEGGTT